jgi:glycerophosphoryl diester phosphodiesterase
MERPLIYAHRGASLELPENTLHAFELALSLGADALELDAHMTADGFVVVSHDESGMRMAGLPTPIRRTRLREVLRWDVGWGFVDGHGRRPYSGKGYSMPTLAEVIAAFPGVVLNVDAKQESPSMMRAMLEVIAAGAAEHRVRVASFSSRNLREALRLGWTGKLGMAERDVARLYFAPDALLSRSTIAADAAQIPLSAGPLRLATQGFVDKAHRHGVRVDFWTVNDVETARALAGIGADGIMTDDPRTVAPAVRALGDEIREGPQRRGHVGGH